jgi:hypothetical protein
MKKFLEFDIWISIMLITGFALASIIKRDYTLFTGYFVVGGWQVISMIVHLFYRRSLHVSKLRSFYHFLTLISIVTMPGSFYVLLYVAPIMAVFYTWLCFDEVRKMNQRPLDLLK